EQKDLLITGINPSFNEKKDVNGILPFCFREIVYNDHLKDNYWRNMRKMVYDALPGIDLRPRAAYLDIFYFRHKGQDAIRKEFIRFEKTNDWRNFAIDQLELTQYTIENVIKPKLIVVANKESYAYWGKIEKKYVWMGYTFSPPEKTQYGELCTITGLQSSPERINRDLKSTQLEGRQVLFSEYPAVGQPTAASLQTLLAQVK
ncbi:MAG: hypothetical protein LBF81_03415, partial [Prevotellaceae bacterium]|nr:hypothetical protein [Prevotellaceae bacterium]